MRRRWLQRRLLFAELRLEDAEYHLAKWGWANTPSEDFREQKSIERKRRAVNRLRRKLGLDEVEA